MARTETVLATISDTEWRLARAEDDGNDTSMMPRPDELCDRLGLAASGQKR